jgi:ABC-type amino acid transport substrate-binding protein
MRSIVRACRPFLAALLFLAAFPSLAEDAELVDCDHIEDSLVGDGRLPCRALPFELRFPGEKRFEQPDGFGHNLLMGGRVAPEGPGSRSDEAVDRAGFVFAPFQWFFSHTPEKALDEHLTESLTLVTKAPAPEILERKDVQADRATARFRATVKGVSVEGEVRVRLHEGYVVALLAWGPPGGKYAPGTAAAKAVLESFRAVRPSAGQSVSLERGMKFQLPPGTLGGGSGMRIGWHFHAGKPLGLGGVLVLDRFEDACDGISDVQGALLDAQFLKFQNPTMTPVVSAKGKGFLVEGAMPDEAPPRFVTTYLFCDGKTYPVRVTFEAPAPNPEVAPFVRALAESVTGPDRRAAELRVAMSGSYWPLHEASDQGCHGLEMSLAEAIAPALGKKALCLPRRDLRGKSPLDAVAQGLVDVALSAITPTEERRQRVDFTEPYVTLEYRLARKAAPEVTELSQLAGKAVAVPAGTGEAEMRAALPGAQVVPAKSLSEAVKLLRAGKVEYAAGEDLGLLALLNDGTETLTGPRLAASPIAMAVPKGKLSVYAPVMAKLAPGFEALRAHYAPGRVPTELGFARCKGEDEPWTYLELRTQKSRQAPPEKKPWLQPLALGGEDLHLPEEFEVCASVSLQPAAGAPPKKLFSQVRARVKELASTLPHEESRHGYWGWFEELSLERIEWAAVKWHRRPGLWVTLVPVQMRGVCANDMEGETDKWGCGELRFVAVVIAGEQVTVGLVESIPRPFN